MHQHQPMLNLKCTATLALHSNFVYTFYASNYRLQRTVSFLIFHSATMCARCCGHHTKSTNNSIYVTLERKFHFVPFRSVRLNQINMTIQAQILRRHTPTPLLLTANAMYLISHSTIVCYSCPNRSGADTTDQWASIKFIFCAIAMRSNQIFRQ